MPTDPAAHWLALALGVLVWGAVLAVFSVRILRFVLGTGLSGMGNAFLKIVASACLVLLYVFSPFGQMLAIDIAYSLISPNRYFDLNRQFYTWITPAIGAISVIVTILVVWERPTAKRILNLWGHPNGER